MFAAEPHAPQRTYQLTREVVEFHRAVSPLRDMLADLRDELKDRGSGSDLELRRALRDVADHVTRVNDRVEGFRQLLRTSWTSTTPWSPVARTRRWRG